jgi:hypothetical protein
MMPLSGCGWKKTIYAERDLVVGFRFGRPLGVPGTWLRHKVDPGRREFRHLEIESHAAQAPLGALLQVRQPRADCQGRFIWKQLPSY